MNATLWRSVRCRNEWITCRRSLRLSLLAQNKRAPEPYVAVVVRVHHGMRWADILVPTRDDLKSILLHAIDDTNLPMRLCARGMRFEFFSSGQPIGPSHQRQINLGVLIELGLKCGSLASDPRFKTTARSFDELQDRVQWVDCEVEVREGDE